MFVRGEWKDKLQSKGKYLQATHQTKDLYLEGIKELSRLSSGETIQLENRQNGNRHSTKRMHRWRMITWKCVERQPSGRRKLTSQWNTATHLSEQLQ